MQRESNSPRNFFPAAFGETLSFKHGSPAGIPFRNLGIISQNAGCHGSEGGNKRFFVWMLFLSEGPQPAAPPDCFLSDPQPSSLLAGPPPACLLQSVWGPKFSHCRWSRATQKLPEE